jgi:hypothetical protein
VEAGQESDRSGRSIARTGCRQSSESGRVEQAKTVCRQSSESGKVEQGEEQARPDCRQSSESGKVEQGKKQSRTAAGRVQSPETGASRGASKFKILLASGIDEHSIKLPPLATEPSR